MKISILCSDPMHPINDYLDRWIANNQIDHDIELVRHTASLRGGDLLFLVSCCEIVGADVREEYRWALVIHASPLPLGRGWSPHVWALIEGAETLTLSLIEAEDKVDTGRVWRQITFPVARHALWQEINHELFTKEIELIDFAVKNCMTVEPEEQCQDREPTYYRRRTPEDSELDPSASIAQQFNLMRVCDPQRYPAFVRMYGHKYLIKIEKADD